MLKFFRFSFTKPFLILFIFISGSKITFAQSNDILKWNLKPSIGIYQSDFDWSIAGNTAGKNPNILSELIWKNIKGTSLGFDIKYNVTKRISIKAINEYSTIIKGDAKDTDYADDNRQSPYFNEAFNANKGYIFNSNFRLGYQIVNYKTFTVTPLAGLSYNQQQFYILENANDPESSGLNSTYQTKHKGFDFGTEVIYKTKYFSLGAEILVGFYTYSAKANWNLIPAFAKPVSFTHQANSLALNGKINLSIPVSKNVKIEIDYKLNHIKTYSGVDRAYFINQTSEETQFNGAKFKKNAILFGLNFML